MYLLDTYVISEIGFARSAKANVKVVSWARSQKASELYISVISLMEIERSILGVERVDEHQGKTLRRWFNRQLKAVFAPRTLDINAAIAEKCAQLNTIEPLSERNAMMAATAFVAKMTLVTHDTKAFINTGLPLINPWQ